MRKYAGMQACRQGSPFNQVPMLRHFVLGKACHPVLQLRDMQHFVEEGDGLMFLHGIKEKKMPGHFCPDSVYMPAPINRRVICHRKRGMTLGKPPLSPTWIRRSHAKGICCPFLSKNRNLPIDGKKVSSKARY